MTVYKWSTTAASNATADTTVNAREGQAPSTLNDAMRGMMAAVAKWRDDMAGALLTGGTSTAYTLTTNQVFSALADGLQVTARMSAANGASATLNVDGLGAKDIQTVPGTALVAGRLRSGGIYTFTYYAASTVWLVNNLEVGAIPSGTDMVFYEATAPTGWTSASSADYALRTTTQAAANGGTSGGSTAFSSVFTARTIAQGNLPSVNFTVTGTTNTTGSHNHSYNSPDASTTDMAVGGLSVIRSRNTSANTGSDGSHSHTVSGTAASGGSGTALDFAVLYYNVIIATYGG